MSTNLQYWQSYMILIRDSKKEPYRIVECNQTLTEALRFLSAHVRLYGQINVMLAMEIPLECDTDVRVHSLSGFNNLIGEEKPHE